MAFGRLHSIVAGLAGLAAMTAGGSQALGAEARQVQDGTLRDGSPAQAVELSNGHGVTARILAYGATLQSLALPDRRGRIADVVLGHDTSAEYEAHQDYFGATVGRYANRIARGSFTLDGHIYRLPLNDGENALHGGGQGFDRQVWRIARVAGGPVASVELTLVSPDGAMGFPGEVRASVTYALADSGELTITYAATTTKPTILALTNHALFNLAGHDAPGGVLAQRLTVAASRYTPVSATLIPTGELAPVAGTPFDFRQPRVLSDGVRRGGDPQIAIGRGYDHNWVLDKGRTATPQFAARLEDPASGRAIEVLTTEPGIQVYSGNFINGTVAGKGGVLYRMGDGLALETQVFPDTPNQPAFGSARLDPGQTYRQVTVLRPAIAR